MKLNREKLIELITTVLQNTDKPNTHVIADAIINNLDLITEPKDHFEDFRHIALPPKS